jgi:hypothetical protein
MNDIQRARKLTVCVTKSGRSGDVLLITRALCKLDHSNPIPATLVIEIVAERMER